MFIVLLKYVKPLEEIDALLPGHIKFLEHQYKKSKFIFSGRRNPRIGGVILVNVDSERELHSILKEDPFYIHKVAEYETIEFIPTKYDPNFKCFIDKH
ncbi:dimeric alpha-beta barrel [Lucifera butyrica]|uniref:Dimeric alpha-beta barrel n=1 Tax=Lucifera butyrica TaxID=1351585 RepID=A0A498R8Q5_9FIRM|nr:YciI family protein [Lucifera butyrica]VBB07894.1 dimeric alpha-beta barrel [Lucifera butyrica]